MCFTCVLTKVCRTYFPVVLCVSGFLKSPACSFLSPAPGAGWGLRTTVLGFTASPLTWARILSLLLVTDQGQALCIFFLPRFPYHSLLERALTLQSVLFRSCQRHSQSVCALGLTARPFSSSPRSTSCSSFPIPSHWASWFLS